MKNFVFPIWGAAYVIFIHQAIVAKSSEWWVFAIILFFQMPLILISYIKSSAAARDLRAILVFLQLPFAVMFFFRFSVQPKWFGMMILLYLAASAAVSALIRKRFPNDVNKI